MTTIAAQKKTTPFEDGYKVGLTGEDPRSNPYSDWKEHAEWVRGHSMGVELYREKHDKTSN